MKNQLTHYVTFLRNIRLNKFELFFKHKKYLKKVFFEISVKKNKKVVYEKGKSVFILNACINPFDHQDNSTYNAPTNIHDRYEQVIKGIQSVRETFQSSDIVYIENSNIPINFENQIKNVVDLYFNFSSNKFLQYSRKITNKGVPWTMANLLCLKKLQTVKQYEEYHFLNARYQIAPVSNKNDETKTRKRFMHVKMKRHNICLIYFYFADISVSRVIRIFRNAHLLSVCGFSTEDIFSINFFNKVYLYELGVTGLVNAREFCKE